MTPDWACRAVLATAVPVARGRAAPGTPVRRCPDRGARPIRRQPLPIPVASNARRLPPSVHDLAQIGPSACSPLAPARALL